MRKAVHASEGLEAALAKAAAVCEKLKVMKLPKAAEKVKTGISETLAYYHFPREHWRRIRTNNTLERIMKEILRRNRVVGAFPDGHSALMLCVARLRHIVSAAWGRKRYLNMELLKDLELEEENILEEAV